MLPGLEENEVKRAFRLLQTCTPTVKAPMCHRLAQQGLIYPSYSLMIKNLEAADAKMRSYDAVSAEK